MTNTTFMPLNSFTMQIDILPGSLFSRKYSKRVHMAQQKYIFST